jgi:predicted RNase H-like HicB family nuclease
MKIPNLIQFFIQTSEDGGYTAEAVGFPIFTQGETLDETVLNIREAVECHFDQDTAGKNSLPITVNFAVPSSFEYA